MHARDLKYVNQLFRAYVTEEKMMETLRLAEAQGINTVFETGANFVNRYNQEFGGHMQFIPHIQVSLGQTSSRSRTTSRSRSIREPSPCTSGASPVIAWFKPVRSAS
jgi:hypothetical protein